METKAQTRVENSWRCKSHPGFNVSLCCSSCTDELICVKCVTSNHSGHNFSQFEDVMLKKKTTIENFMQKYEKEVIPSLEKKLKAVLDKQRKNKQYTIDLIESIMERGKQMKKVIDKRMEDLIEMCKRIENINDDNLLQVADSINKIHENVKQKLSRGKIILKRLNLPEMVNATNEGSLPSTEIEGKAEIERMIFVTRRQGTELSILNDQYGSVQPIGTDTCLSLLPAKYPLTCKFLNEKELERQQESSDGKFKMMAEESKTFTFPCPHHFIVKCPEGMLMATNTELTLVSQSGKPKTILTLSCRFENTTYLKGYGIVLCGKHNGISQIKSNGEVIEIISSNNPFSMAMSFHEQLLVSEYDGYSFGIYEYEVPSCHVKQQYMHEGYGKRMSVNRKSGDIAMATDFEMILVLDKTLKPKFWYCGLMDSSPRKPDRLTQNRMRGLFQPQDVCFDSPGHILIADKITMSILALNSDGKLVKVITQFNSVPLAVGTDDLNQLWIALDDKTVKVIKYLQ